MEAIATSSLSIRSTSPTPEQAQPCQRSSQHPPIEHRSLGDSSISRLSAIKSAFSCCLKPCLHLPSFSIAWLKPTHYANVSIGKINQIRHSSDFIKVTIPITPIRVGNHLSTPREMTLYFFPGKGNRDTLKSGEISNAHQRQQIIYSPGGGYMFGPETGFSNTRYYTDADIDVWVPKFSKLTDSFGEDISLRNLEESTSLFRYLVESLQIPDTQIGFFSESAGSDPIFRFWEYRTAIGQPIHSPLDFCSPVHLESVDKEETLQFNAHGECILPKHQVVSLVEAIDHKPIDDLVVNRHHAFPFQQAGPCRVTGATGEALEPTIRNVCRTLHRSNVDIEFTLVRGAVHAFVNFHGLIPEATDSIKESVQWMKSALAKPPYLPNSDLS